MGNLQMENISEALKNVEDVESLRDIPEEHREEFTVFMRLMKARALDEIEEISDETILGFFEKIPVFASYMDIGGFSWTDLQSGFHTAQSARCRHVL